MSRNSIISDIRGISNFRDAGLGNMRKDVIVIRPNGYEFRKKLFSNVDKLLEFFNSTPNLGRFKKLDCFFDK